MQTLAPIQLEMARVIRAPRQRVYEAWTRPEIVQQWFGPSHMMVPDTALDVREGGHYRIEFRETCGGTEGSTSAATGVYRRVVPNELLEFTWCGSWDPSATSLVTISLRDVEGGTELTLRHEQFPTEESRDRHQIGWLGSFEKLAKVLEG
jgi:uncharacterized protein YndB with AHSA1/START domain